MRIAQSKTPFPSTQTGEAGRLARQTRLLIPRLEKLSPDSAYAHRASGVRIALLRILQRVEEGQYSTENPAVTRAGDLEYLGLLVRRSYELLEGAAREHWFGTGRG